MYVKHGSGLLFAGTLIIKKVINWIKYLQNKTKMNWDIFLLINCIIWMTKWHHSIANGLDMYEEHVHTLLIRRWFWTIWLGWLAGFKATLNYEKCLEERSATIYALYSSTSSDLSTTTVPLPECDLEKELDSVSIEK